MLKAVINYIHNTILDKVFLFKLVTTGFNSSLLIQSLICIIIRFTSLNMEFYFKKLKRFLGQ